MAIDPRSLIRALALVLAPCCLIAADPNAAPTEYQDWIAHHKHGQLTSWVPQPTSMVRHAVPLKLAITGFEREDEVPSQPSLPAEIVHRREVTTDGRLPGLEYYGISGNTEFGAAPLPTPKMERLDQLLAALPDDGAHLPPPNRRVLVEAAVGDKTVERVYDRGGLPAAVAEIFRLVHCRIHPYVPEFRPGSELAAGGYVNPGFLGLSPDGKQLLFSGPRQSLQFWEPTTHELLRELRDTPSEALAFSPDGSQAVIAGLGTCLVFDTKTWERRKIRTSAYSIQFLPDGQHALLKARKQPLEIYDTATWQPVDHLPAVPDGAMQYIPAPKTARAVVQTASGAVSLWDTAASRPIVQLAENADLLRAAFSPDESMVVVATHLRNLSTWVGATPLDIWRADTGQKLRDLRQFTGRTYIDDEVSDLLWLPDGKHLLVGESDVGIFDIQTGRQCARLGNAHRINGVVLLPGSNQLAVGSTEGKIQFWDFPTVMEDIQAFEKSLPADLK